MAMMMAVANCEKLTLPPTTWFDAKKRCKTFIKGEMVYQSGYWTDK